MKNNINFLAVILGLLTLSNITNAQWKSISGLHERNINAVIKSDSILFAGTIQGFFSSSNYGEVWGKHYPEMSKDEITSFALISDSFDIAYLFTCTKEEGVFVSEDNGKNWTNINSDLIGPKIIAGSGMEIYAGTVVGLYRTLDYGNSWEIVDSNMTNNIFSFAVKDTILLISTTDSLTFLSTNDGLDWIETSLGLNNRVNSFLILDTTFFAATDSGLFYSTLSNNIWMKIDSGLTNQNINSIYAIRDNSNENILFVGTDNGAFRSSDYGKSWNAIDSGLTDQDVRCFYGDSQNIFAGTLGGGMFRSTDNGLIWVEANSGLNTGFVRNMCTSGSNIMVSTSSGILYSPDEGTNWNILESDINTNVDKFANINNFLFASTEDSGIYRSSDNGIDWTKADSGFNGIALSFAVLDSHLIAGTNDALYTSADWGMNWNKISTSGLPVEPYYEFAIIDTFLFAGPHGIYRSSDYGKHWYLASGNSIDEGIRYFITINSDHIAIGLFRGIYRSTNNGESWASFSSAPSRTTSYAAYKTNLFATGFHQVYVSEDAGLNWTDVSEGLPSGALFTSVVVMDSNLYIGSVGEGVFRRPISEVIITGIDDNKIIPKAFSLSQNYPNPFNPSTTIRFQISKESFVQLKIYDILGREIVTLVNEEKPAGIYEVEFDGSKISSGVYFCNIYIENFTDTKKLVLLK